MRRLTWTNLLRTTLLAAGIALGAGAVLAPSILQSTLFAAEDSPKKPRAGDPDVDALIKSAVGDALKDAGLDGKKPAKGAAEKGAEADRLKELQKKLGSRQPKSNDDKDAPFVGPPRSEKTKKGIDKLPNLTSAAKVIVNGETIALSHVLAYETVSAGEWVTRIYATDKPIKQESWIERLRQPGENKDFDLHAAPFLLLELDDKDRPYAINFAVQKFQTSAGRRNFMGEAIVEDGRARGSIQTKEPVEFGGRTITAEITFDAPLLTRDSQPTKQSDDAPKLETSEPDKPKKGIAKLPKLESSGNLQVNDKPVKLGNVVAYELMVSGKKTTAINFTDKPIPLPKLKALLAKEGTDLGLFDFDTFLKRPALSLETFERSGGDRRSSLNAGTTNNKFTMNVGRYQPCVS